MFSWMIAGAVLVCACAGVFLGSLLRERLPDHHVRDDSKDVVKTASGMIATLVALVIGLLVSSAKSSFDQANAGLTQIGARLIVLDRTLARYGPETAPIRERIRQGIALSLERLWPTTPTKNTGIKAIESSTSLDEVQEAIRRLVPQDDERRSIQAQAVQACGDLLQSRWLMIEQAQTTLPTAFLVILIFWLSVLFATLGLLAPRNRTSYSCLLICALSMAGAIFLILEMNQPYEGLIQVSPAPLQKALAFVGR